MAPAPAAHAGRPVAASLPAWLDLGMLVIGLGALLVAIGFFLFTAGVGNTNPSGFYQGYGVLVGVGVIVATLGWFLHKMLRSHAGTGSA